MDSIALVMPALNEEDAVEQLLGKIPENVSGYNVETYIIDGGSKDNTQKIVRESGAELINQSYEGGKGSAMREALDSIDADIYVFMDADMTYPPEELEKLVRPIKKGEADHVIGSRLEKRDEDAFMYRNLYGNKMLGWFYRRLTGSNIQDFLTGYRAISSDLAKQLDLESTGFEIETEITFKTLDLEKEIKEVNIHYRARVGESKLDFKKEGLKIPLYGLKLSILGLD